MDKLPETFGPLLAQHLREQLNQLIASVQLLTPVIREQGERYDPYLAILNQSIFRIMRLTGNLEFSQLPEGDVILCQSPLDLAGLCRELGEQVAHLARQLGVQFSVDDTVGSLLLTGDAVLLRRMLMCLVSNALRAAGEGGQAGLRIATCRGRVTLTVWDNGLGMEGERGTDKLLRVEGLGLGLPVARRIAALHGGTLVLEQQDERGLRVIVALPVTRVAESSVLKTPVMGYDGTGGFSPILVELSDILPYDVFLPEDVD